MLKDKNTLKNTKSQPKKTAYETVNFGSECSNSM